MQAKQLNLVPFYVMLLVLSVVAIFAMVAKSVGIALNVTGSMPDLVYQLGHGEKGSLASFCSPIPHPSIGHGACPDGSMPLIKRVVGVAGDRVTATNHGVEINGQPVPNSRPLDLDAKGQALPHVRGIFVLKQGEIWTAGEHPNSFDSRYFGPVKFQGVAATTEHANPCSDLSNSDRFAERVRQGGRIASFDQKCQPFRSNETTDSGVNVASVASHSNSKPQPERAHTR